MKISYKIQSIVNFEGDIVIVNLFEKVKVPGGATGVVNKFLKDMISKLISTGELTGKLGEYSLIHNTITPHPAKFLIIGLGPREKFRIEEIRKVAGTAARVAERYAAKKVGSIVHGAGIGGIEPARAAQAVIEGTILALYEFTQYKIGKDKKITDFILLESDPKKEKALEKGLETGVVLGRCQNIARDLVNEPANNLTPLLLLKKIKNLLKELKIEKKIIIEVMDKTQMAKAKMGSLLSVAQGSNNEPLFISLRYKGSKKPLISLIGKTVTFDSGGLSLKPPEGMGAMKGDMAGGAAALGTTLALALLRKPTNLLTIIPAVENLPSGTASRPGDVVRAMNGKSIEIISTDAEGRMTMADAICFAEKAGARTIIDISTLTGASVIALGDATAALMSNNENLIEKIKRIGEDCGEHYWPLPLFPEYSEQIKSDIADLKNAGGRKAGAITAGAFLQHFVAKAKWLHIDIAGKESRDTEGPYLSKGATGFGVRTLFHLINTL